MTETNLVIPTDILKTIYNGASTTAMGLKSVLIMVEHNKVIVKHINESLSAMLKFESREFQPGADVVKLPIDVADLKTVVNLAKDVPEVTFVIDGGTTVCKVGRTKKQFAQPETGRLPEKEPKFEVKAAIEMDDAQTTGFIAAFSDLKEQGDLKITASPEKIVFRIEELNRFTEVEFTPGDLVSFVGNDATVGYDSILALSIFKIKQKGANMNIEIGKDAPMRVIQKTDSGVLSILLAPKIY